ncbi:MAG: xanthine dehydrogenase family protein subunit M [Candidatus Bathyarchaeia archaeon]|jgi:CO/xanthine dehydrogenase FAD-binding subunit
MRSEIDVITPRTLDEALNILHQGHAELKIVAGGSDVIVQLRDGVLKVEKLLNILSLKELRFIREQDGLIHVGSLATYSDITNSQLAKEHAWVLVDASRQIGAVQLQNTATLGGNLGNASPAGDSLPPLYALEAVVVTRSKSGRRETPVEQFFVSYRKTALRPDELIEEVYFKPMNSKDRGAYMKLGLREANAISIVDVAVVLRERSRDGSFAEARVALGAVAPVITRARKSEKALEHTPLKEKTLREAATLAADDAAPIDDIRGSAEYRKEMVVSSVYQALYEAVYGRKKNHE